MSSFEKLPQLQTLNLQYTKITDDGLKYLETLKELQVLDLTETQVSDNGFAHLSRLKGLKKLTVPHTTTDAALIHLKALTNLELLQIAEAPGARSGGAMNPTGPEPKEVALESCHFTDQGARDLLAAIPKLNIVRQTDLQEAGRMALALFHKFDGHLDFDDYGAIVELDMNKPEFDDGKLFFVKGLTTLRKLSLSRTSITDSGLAYLSEMTKLQDLDLTGTRVTDAGAANLKKTLPNLKIHR